MVMMTATMRMMDSEENGEADDAPFVHIATAIEISHKSYECYPCWLIDKVVRHPTFALNGLLLAQRFSSIGIGRTNDTTVGRRVLVIKIMVHLCRTDSVLPGIGLTNGVTVGCQPKTHRETSLRLLKTCHPPCRGHD